MADIFRSQGRFFIQDDEDDPLELLTCTGVGDVEIPCGDETPVYCPSLEEVGAFVVSGAVQGEAGFTTYSLDRPLRSVLNTLITELCRCRWHGRINWNTIGNPPDIPADYIVGLHLHNSRATTRGIPTPAIIAPGDNERVNTTADINAYNGVMIYPLTSTRIAQTEVSAINGVAFDLSAGCYTDIGEAGGDYPGKDGYYTTDHTATSPAVSADIWHTTEYGAEGEWTVCTTDPFGAAEDAGAVVTRGGRVIVARLTSDAGNPAEIAYSDDYGVTWTNVNVGSVNGQVVNDMTWLDWTHLWACTTGGYVYFSDDAGETWTAQTSGGVTAQDLNGIDAVDRQNVWAVGDAGAIIRTTTGSAWALVTGPAGVADAFTTVLMRNTSRVFIGSDAGRVYRTNDAGQSAAGWETKGTPNWSGGAVVKITADPSLRYFMLVAGNTSAPVGEVYRSEDGGATFQEVDNIPTNVGLNDMFQIDENEAWIGGEPQAGTAFLARIHEVS
jgi:hypothetical protein